MGALREYWQNGQLVRQDTRTLQEAKDEASDRVKAGLRAQLEAQMPPEQQAYAAFRVTAPGNGVFDTIAAQLSAARTKLAGKNADIAAATTNAQADAVVW